MGFDVFERFGPGSGLTEVLRLWVRANPRPLVLLIEEFDMLVGDSLLAALRHLRAGYPNRPRELPQCVVPCGVRDLRDYRIQSGTTGETVAGHGVFNISAGSLRLGDFSEAEVESLPGADRRDRPRVPSSSDSPRVGPNLRPAVAGERPVRPSLFPEQAGTGTPSHRGRHFGSLGTARIGAHGASRPTR